MENWHRSLCKCSLIIYSLRPTPECSRPPLPPACVCCAHWTARSLCRGSQLSGDDGEGEYGVAGLQLQGSEKAVDGSLILALVLQHLTQALPGLVAGALPLHSIPQHLLGQALVAQFSQHQTLEMKQRAGLTRPGQREPSNQRGQQQLAPGHQPERP